MREKKMRGVKEEGVLCVMRSFAFSYSHRRDKWRARAAGVDERLKDVDDERWVLFSSLIHFTPLSSPLSPIIFSCICVSPHFLAVFHWLLSYITSLLDPLIPPCLLISLPLPLSHPKFLPLPRPLILLSFHYFFPIFLLASLFFPSSVSPFFSCSFS